MRGGTSRGAYFLRKDLPAETAMRDEILLRVMGSPDTRQIDGLGGAGMLTSKVAIVEPSARRGIDLDYTFSQVYVDKAKVDSNPTCGNILTAVGCFGIEVGLIQGKHPQTEVKIYDVNTGYTVHQTIQTPDGKVNYTGDHAIAGVPGTAAPLGMRFTDIAGAKTGRTFPTGNPMDEIDGKRMSCIDIAMPTVFLDAKEWGISGYETKQQLDADRDFISRLLVFRKQAALKMGLDDVGDGVIPKVAFVAKPREGGNLCGRYFTPFQCHDAFALSAAFGAAAGSFLDGTLLHELADLATARSQPSHFALEHPAGKMELEVQVEDEKTISATIVRTARLIMRGEVAIPRAAA